MRIRPGQTALLVRAAAFVILLFLLVPLALAWAPALLGKKLLFTLNFDRSTVFLLLMLGFFALKNRRRLLELSAVRAAWWEPFFFGAFSLLAFSWYFAIRYLLSGNFVLENFGVVVIASYAAYLVGSVALWVAAFGLGFSASFARRFSKELAISLVAAAFFMEFSLVLQAGWKLFSDTLTSLVYWLLAATTPDAVVALSKCCAPLLGCGDFKVLIGAPCSGIDSISLFTVLFLGILAYDWHEIDKKRAALVFVPGLVGIWLMNVVRIYSLVLLGAFVSPELAVGLFHENAGWIFFAVFCAAFWYFAYPFVRRGEKVRKPKAKRPKTDARLKTTL